MTTTLADPAAWDFMTVELPATAPGGFVASMSPSLPALAPLHAGGWQVHEHMYMGNGYVRVTLRRGRAWKPAPAALPVMDWAPLEAAKAAREDELSEGPPARRARLRGPSFGNDGEQSLLYGESDADRDPRGSYISRKAEEDVAMAVPNAIAYREAWFARPAGSTPALVVSVDADGVARADVYEAGTVKAGDLGQLTAAAIAALNTVLLTGARQQDVGVHPLPILRDQPAGTPIDDSAARRVWGIAP